MTLREAARHAAGAFRVFEDGPSNLVPYGWSPIQEALGGEEPGQLCVLAGFNGLGKSRAVLASCIPTGDGYISLEDGAAAMGSRAIAQATGLDSLRLRRKDLSKGDLRRIRALLDAPEPEIQARVVDCTAGTLEMVEEAVDLLAEAGCKRAWLDYLQKVRGVHEDRRHEVGAALTRFQRRCSMRGMAAGVVCQFKRAFIPDGQGGFRPASKHDRPERGWLKESGDIENEARTIMFLWQPSPDSPDLLLEVDKASYGGEGASVWLRPDASGMLREVNPKEDL